MRIPVCSKSHQKNVLNFGFANLISEKIVSEDIYFLIYITLIRTVWHPFYIYLEVIYISFSVDQIVFRTQRNERLIPGFQIGASIRSV